MVEVSTDEAALFFDGRIILSVASLWLFLVVVVVAPFSEVVCKFEARCVSRGILEVNDYELLMAVGWEEKR